MKLITKIIIGVAIGSVIGYAIIFIVNMQIAKMEAKAFSQQMEMATNGMQKSMPKITPQYIRETKPTWIPGRSLEKCMGSSKEINERVIKCRNGYWIDKKINHQRVKEEKQRKRKIAALKKAKKYCKYLTEQIRKERTKETIKNQGEACELKAKISRSPASNF